MLNNRLGPSKQTFLETKVITAKDDDTFNNNKCAFCWGPYHEHHPGVRILPCNHVFGRTCLNEMIQAPNGNVCPICRTAWFRLSVSSAVRPFLFSLRAQLWISLTLIVLTELMRIYFGIPRLRFVVGDENMVKVVEVCQHYAGGWQALSSYCESLELA